MLLGALVTAAALSVGCPSNVANDLRPAAAGSQLITVETVAATSTYASLRTWRLSRGCWRPVAGPYLARVGRNGVRKNRREGDGTTPIGTFRIGPTMYGNEPNPGVRFRYRRLSCAAWWVEDPTSRLYNTFQHVPCGKRPPFKVSGRPMSQEPRAYPYLAVVEFNMHPIVRGRGSGIFLHAQTGGPTNGCISLRRGELVRVLRWLSPEARPRIAIGTRAQFRS